MCKSEGILVTQQAMLAQSHNYPNQLVSDSQAVVMATTWKQAWNAAGLQGFHLKLPFL